MQSLFSKKNELFKRQIRREQIQSYKKNRRLQLLDYLEEHQHKKQQKSNYMNILHLSTFDNISNMDEQTFNNHLQMLNQISSSPDSSIYSKELESTVDALVDFFNYSLNRCEKNINFKSNIPFDDQETIIQMVAMHKMFCSINANSFIKLIEKVYHEIIPLNISLLRKVLILMKNILAFSLKDSCVLKDYLKKAGQEQSNPVSQRIDKKNIINIFMNITYHDEEEIIDIFYDLCIIQEISEWIQVYGFTEQQKESLAGLYGNLIQYLCKKVDNLQIFEYQEKDNGQRPRNYYLFLSIYDDLIKINNPYIMQKMLCCSIYLIDIVVKASLNCKEYIFDLVQNLIRNIVYEKQYIDLSEDLFIIVAGQFQFNPSIDWFLNFLIIILNNYCHIYYKSKVLKELSQPTQSQLQNKNLNQISRLINCCGQLLESQKVQIIRQLCNFWSKQQLEPVQSDFLDFMSIALSSDSALPKYCFDSDKCSQVLIALMDKSYQHSHEIQSALKLTTLFVSRLDQMSHHEKQQFIGSYVFQLNSIIVRLEDYCSSSQVKQYLNKQAQANLERLSSLMKEVDVI